MARRNSLPTPAEAIEVLAETTRKRRDKQESTVRSTVEKIKAGDFWVGDEAWVGMRWAAREAGTWASLCEIVSWLDEAHDLLGPETTDAEVEEIFVALDQRATATVIEPNRKTITTWFDEAQQRFDINFTGVRFPKAEYGDYFHAPVDVFAYYYSFNGEFGLFSWHLEIMLGAMRAADIYDYERATGYLVNLRHKQMADEISDERLAQVLDDINSTVTSGLISSYGVRRGSVIETPDFTILTWSNGGAHWIINARVDASWLIARYVHGKPGYDTRALDSDSIVVPFPEQVVELILSSIYPHPNYGASMEGKAKRRARGAGGPLVSDKAARVVLMSIMRARQLARNIELYGDVAKTYAILDKDIWGFQNTWEKLLEMKAAGDEEAFKAYITDELRADDIAAFYGQLVNWFQGRDLQGDSQGDVYENPDIKATERAYLAALEASLAGEPRAKLVLAELERELADQSRNRRANSRPETRKRLRVVQ